MFCLVCRSSRVGSGFGRCSSLRGRPRLRGGAALSGGGGSSFLSFVSFLTGFSRASISVASRAITPTMRNGAQWIRLPQTSKLARMNIPLAILIIVGGLAAAAFFAGAETALTAASRARMQALETGGDKRAALANRLIAQRGRLISAMLLGGQFVTIAASAYTTSVLVAEVGDRGVVYATVIMTALIVVFGEVLPKTVAIAYPDRVSLLIAPPVAFFVTLFGPIVSAVELFVRGVLRLCGVSLGHHDPGVSGHEELMGAVDILHREGEVERDERDMFGGLLELSEIPVSDVMVHRTKMRLIDADLPPEELVREVIASPYTRMPLWRGEPDNIIGVLHAKDLLRAYVAAGGDASKLNIGDLTLQPWLIPESTTLR